MLRVRECVYVCVCVASTTSKKTAAPSKRMALNGNLTNVKAMFR